MDRSDFTDADFKAAAIFIETVFRDRGQLADANAAVFQLKQARLREARAQRQISKRLWPELEWLFWGLSCGYGTKIWRIICWAILVDLLFAFVYWLFAEIKRTAFPAAEREESHGSGHTYIDADIAGMGFIAEFARGSTAAGEQAGHVAILATVDNLNGVINRVGMD